MNDGSRKVATYKERSTCPLPYRSGPVQCIKSCSNCFTETPVSHGDTDRFRNLLCFDDLVSRKSLWLQAYNNIQFHTGQVSMLKEAIKKIKQKGDSYTIYVVSSVDDTDLAYLNRVLEHIGFPEAHKSQNLDNFSNLVLSKKAVAILVRPWHSYNRMKETANHTSPLILKHTIEQILRLAKDNSILVVPVAINKDHNRWSLHGLGSVCIQISEPVLPQNYNPYCTLSTSLSDNFARHLYFDLAQITAILPSNIVAFLLLYLERDECVDKSELVEFMDWLRQISIDTTMHVGFTGTSAHCVEFGLLILKEHIVCVDQNKFKVRNTEKLEDYASPLVSIFAYHGLICRAILAEYNANNEYSALTMFTNQIPIRVLKDNVMEICSNLAPHLERLFACKSPCVSVDDAILKTMTFMEKFERFLTVEEPKILSRKERQWACESDSDDEYWASSVNNPALKAWIRLTTRAHRLDRMNLLLNAVESHLFVV